MESDQRKKHFPQKKKMHINMLTKCVYGFSGFGDLGKSVKSRLKIPILKCLEVWNEASLQRCFFSI